MRLHSIARVTFPAVALLVAGCATPPAGPSTPTPPAPVTVLELKPYVAELLTWDATVGDTTLPLLFDTGGGLTLVTPDAAAAIGCEPFGRLTGFRHSGTLVHLQRCPPASLGNAEWQSPPHELAVFDLMALLPDGLPSLGGLLSLNTFDGSAITIVLGDRQLVVENAPSLANRTASMSELRLRLARQAGGAALDAFIGIDAADGTLWFELDSGNGGAVIIAPHAARQLGLELSPDSPMPVRLEVSGLGPIDVTAIERDMIYDGLLNADFLRQLALTLDLESERAWGEYAASP